MKRTGWKSLQISGEQAAQALHLLVSEGRITAREVYAVLKRRGETPSGTSGAAGSLRHWTV